MKLRALSFTKLTKFKEVNMRKATYNNWPMTGLYKKRDIHHAWQVNRATEARVMLTKLMKSKEVK